MRTAVVVRAAAVLIVAGCARHPAGAAATAGPKALGSLHVTSSVERGPVTYFEGAVPLLLIRDASGHVVADQHRGGTLDVGGLRPGLYSVTAELMPCDGTCDQLDPARDACSVQVRVDGSARRLAVTSHTGEPCTVRVIAS